MARFVENGAVAEPVADGPAQQPLVGEFARLVSTVPLIKAMARLLRVILVCCFGVLGGWGPCLFQVILLGITLSGHPGAHVLVLPTEVGAGDRCLPKRVQCGCRAAVAL